MTPFQKIITGITILLCTAFLIISAYSIVCFNELSTILSYESYTDEKQTMYYAKIEGDYYTKDFYDAKGAYTNSDLSKFLTVSTSKKMMALSKINISTPSFESNTITYTDTNKNLGTTYHSSSNYSMVIETNQKNKYSSVSTINLSSLSIDDDLNFLEKNVAFAAAYLPVNGLNETGLSVSLTYTNKLQNEITYKNSKDVDITESVLVRLILDNASTVEEALDIVDNYDLHLSNDNHFNITITDINGNTSSIYTTEDLYITEYLLKINKQTVNIDQSLTDSNIFETLNSFTSQNDKYKNNYNVVYNLSTKTAQYNLFGDDETKLIIQL